MMPDAEKRAGNMAALGQDADIAIRRAKFLTSLTREFREREIEPPVVKYGPAVEICTQGAFTAPMLTVAADTDVAKAVLREIGFIDSHRDHTHWYGEDLGLLLVCLDEAPQGRDRDRLQKVRLHGEAVLVEALEDVILNGI
jgi:hypothetical protein